MPMCEMEKVTASTLGCKLVDIEVVNLWKGGMGALALVIS